MRPIYNPYNVRYSSPDITSMECIFSQPVLEDGYEMDIKKVVCNEYTSNSFLLHWIHRKFEILMSYFYKFEPLSLYD